MQLNSRRKKFGVIGGVVILFIIIFLPVYFLVLSDNNDDTINNGEWKIFGDSYSGLFRIITIIHDQIELPSMKKLGLGSIDRRNLSVMVSHPKPGKRTSTRLNFGTRTSAQILKIFINFDTN